MLVSHLQETINYNSSSRHPGISLYLFNLFNLFWGEFICYLSNFIISSAEQI